MSAVYVLVAIVALGLIAGISIALGRRPGGRTLSPLTAVAMGAVVVGIAFDDRVAAYTLMGIGVTLAVVDIIWRTRVRE